MKLINKKTLAEYLDHFIYHFKINEITDFIEVPPLEINYTYAFPCYRMAKFEKKAPNLIAKDLEKKLPLPEYLEKIEAIGPYLNYHSLNKVCGFLIHRKQLNKIRESCRVLHFLQRLNFPLFHR